MKKSKSGKTPVSEVIEEQRRLTPPKELKLIHKLTRFDKKERFRRAYI